VLPFNNLSAEPNNDYIALGIADAVLHQLASSSELIVISRSSSFALGQPAPEPREIGHRLGVRYLVSGSVQRAGNVLRVTARLIDASTNIEVWSLKLDRTIDDVFGLQDQIAQQVAQQLDATVQSRSLEYARYGTDAYLAFLKGRALIESRKVKDVEASIQQFSQAVELAPTFAAAMAELARARLQLAGLRNEPSAEVTSLRSELDALIDRAIEIEPSAGEPYFMRARRKLDDNDPRGAEDDFRKGLELAPNFGPGLLGYAEYLSDQERDAEALEQLDRARLVEPLSAENHYRKGEILRVSAEREQFKRQVTRSASARLEDAAALYLQALSVQPEFYPAYTRLAQVRWIQGRLAEAIKYGEKSIAVEPAVSWTHFRLVWFYVDLGDLSAARDVLRGHAPGSAAMAASEALVCYRAGNLEHAEAILRSHVGDPDLYEDGFAMLVTPAAIVERAIASRDPSVARRFIMAIPVLKKTRGTPEVVDVNFPWIAQLAILEHAVGSQAVANDLAQRILQYLDPSPDVNDRDIVGGWDEWSRAAASAILERNDAAQAHLENLVRSGLHIGSWARIERDPAFAALRSTPRFQALLSGSQLWLQGEVRQLALMRSRGEVPRRSSEQLSPQGC
jgi:TolB-like protein/Tfp pilus assembly protein PilF